MGGKFGWNGLLTLSGSNKQSLVDRSGQVNMEPKDDVTWRTIRALTPVFAPQMPESLFGPPSQSVLVLWRPFSPDLPKSLSYALYEERLCKK